MEIKNVVVVVVLIFLKHNGTCALAISSSQLYSETISTWNVTLRVVTAQNLWRPEIQSGQDAFDESRFVITFLTILGVTEIFYSFRLVLEGKTGSEIHKSWRLEFLELFLANNFTLSDKEHSTSGPLNWRGIVDLPLLRALLAICQKSPEPNFWEVRDSLVLKAYASLAASRNLLQQLLACLNFSFDWEDLFCKYKKKVISMNYGTSTSSWKPRRWVRFDLILTMRDIYINFNWKKYIHEPTLLWNISQMTTKTIPISTRIVVSFAMKQGIPFWVCW